MEEYAVASAKSSAAIIQVYSSSFGLASRLLPRTQRQHIANIYALVRIADEIVDTFDGPDQLERLDELEREVQRAIQTGYSVNPVVHAFSNTAKHYSIGGALLTPFFDSMRTDISPPKQFSEKAYTTYIHGSAEVVGLMCLRVFVENDEVLYTALKTGAKHLGSAFQKVNFLRDMAADYTTLGRYYFPIGSFERFDDEIRNAVVADLYQDFGSARQALLALPRPQRKAVGAAFNNYLVLTKKLARTSAAELKRRRIRLPNVVKLWLLIRALCNSFVKVPL